MTLLTIAQCGAVRELVHCPHTVVMCSLQLAYILFFQLLSFFAMEAYGPLLFLHVHVFYHICVTV